MWLAGLVLAVAAIGWCCSSNSNQPRNCKRALTLEEIDQLCKMNLGKSPAERRRNIRNF